MDKYDLEKNIYSLLNHYYEEYHEKWFNEKLATGWFRGQLKKFFKKTGMRLVCYYNGNGIKKENYEIALVDNNDFNSEIHMDLSEDYYMFEKEILAKYKNKEQKDNFSEFIENLITKKT